MFILNIQGKEPIYEQIRHSITRFVEMGVLKPGDKLPSVRQLAQDNGINSNTVAKAYQELEKEGVIYTMPKKGAYVADNWQKKENSKELLKSIIKPLKEGGISKEMLLEIVEEVFKD